MPATVAFHPRTMCATTFNRRPFARPSTSCEQPTRPCPPPRMPVEIRPGCWRSSTLQRHRLIDRGAAMADDLRAAALLNPVAAGAEPGIESRREEALLK